MKFSVILLCLLLKTLLKRSFIHKCVRFYLFSKTFVKTTFILRSLNDKNEYISGHLICSNFFSKTFLKTTFILRSLKEDIVSHLFCFIFCFLSYRVVKKHQFMMRFCPNGPQMPMILYGNIEWLLNVIMSVIIYIIGWI